MHLLLLYCYLENQNWFSQKCQRPDSQYAISNMIIIKKTLLLHSHDFYISVQSASIILRTYVTISLRWIIFFELYISIMQRNTLSCIRIRRNLTKKIDVFSNNGRPHSLTLSPYCNNLKHQPPFDYVKV